MCRDHELHYPRILLNKLKKHFKMFFTIEEVIIGIQQIDCLTSCLFFFVCVCVCVYIYIYVYQFRSLQEIQTLPQQTLHDIEKVN
jgi:hypothetical protein